MPTDSAHVPAPSRAVAPGSPSFSPPASPGARRYAKGEAEKIMGAAICQGIENGDWVREDLVLSTKVYFGTRDGPNNKGLSRKHIVEGVKASLDRMGLDYVDIVFCHRPDPVTPIEETVRAMNFIIDKGWCFYWGTSEWSAQQITDACRCADALGLIRPVAEQPEYNLFQRHKVEVEFMPLYRDFGLGTTTWSPLASGVLSGKYRRAGGERERERAFPCLN